MKTVLVTGGAGFIGSHTADLLVKNNFHVIIFDNLSTGKITNLDLLHPHMEFFQGDILDYRAIAKQVLRCDAVLHLAALPSVPMSIEDPINTLKNNTQGFVHVLQAIREAQKPIRLVYASSAAVYGSTAELPCSDELLELSHAALSPYALEKINNEAYADLYSRLFGLNSLALRYFNVYGPRQDPHSPYSGVISRFIDNYRQNKVITIWGDGKQSRDFISVYDIAAANVAALQSDFTGVLNIATGVPETLTNLISYIEAVGGKSAEVNYLEARIGDIRASYGSVIKAEKKLNFKYNTPLAEGIKHLMTHTVEKSL
ncbi:MAG: NAD-dependent epimerase/dehydratase family protein [Gammaproteobacteria bacterium]|nr:NAD-dependent epimerase/dehydratase family protein [Gammaproteobacteria bacterium]